MAENPKRMRHSQAVRLLLDGISACAVFDNSGECTTLRREFQRLCGQLNSEHDAIRVVSKRPETAYGAQPSRHRIGAHRSFRASPSREPADGSLQSVREINESALVRLQTLEKQLAASSSAEDVQFFRSSMAALLDTAKLEGLKQSSLVSDAISQVIRDCRQIVERSAEPVAAPVADDMATRNTDPLTGLPSRARAEPAIVRLVNEEGA